MTTAPHSFLTYSVTSAGELKFRVRFDMPTSDLDPAGGVLKGWAAQFSRRCAIRPLKGSEPVMAQRLQGVQPLIVVVRRDSQTLAVTPSWRLVELQDEASGIPVAYYAIKAPPSDMQRDLQYLTFLATIGQPDGGNG